MLIKPAQTACHGNPLGPTPSANLNLRTPTQFSTQELAKVLYLALVLGRGLKDPMALVTSYRGFTNKLLVPILSSFDTPRNCSG